MSSKIPCLTTTQMQTKFNELVDYCGSLGAIDALNKALIEVDRLNPDGRISQDEFAVLTKEADWFQKGSRSFSGGTGHRSLVSYLEKTIELTLARRNAKARVGVCIGTCPTK